MKPSSQAGTVRHVATSRMPTKWGMFQSIGFERDIPNGSRETESALALVLGDLTKGIPLIRIHSQCFTGEMLGSLRCDCGEQLEMAMRAIASEGRGILIYEYQEGRGIGLSSKLRAYALQDTGLDTVEANHALGFADDCRDFGLPCAILHELGIRKVRLLSNSPQKARALIKAGIKIVIQIACEAPPTSHSFPYMLTKRDRMGHALSLGRNGTGVRAAVRHVHDLNYQGGANEAHTTVPSQFATIDAAIRELREGRMIVVVDDEDRENEGDLVMAADKITPEAINFMATHGRGLICLAMAGERLDELELCPMVPANTALCGTAFTVSIDLKGNGVTTGISAHDRAKTIRAAIEPGSTPDDFGRPGHIFPLRARAGGVLERRGQTEAAVDLASLAGLYPAGVICEIVNDDGTMARVPDLIRFCRMHDLLMITVADLARYRFDTDDEGTFWALEGLIPACLRPSALCATLSPRNKQYATSRIWD